MPVIPVELRIGVIFSPPHAILYGISPGVITGIVRKFSGRQRR
jgi:hypothetical protein